MRALAALAGLAAVFSASSANAAYVVDIQQVGSDVVTTGSGSLDLSGVNSQNVSSPSSPMMRPSSSMLVLGTGGQLVNVYFGLTGPVEFGPGLFGSGVFGPGSITDATSASGALVGLFNNTTLFVPTAYVSGTALGTSTDTFANATFASLGLTPGSYTYKLGSAPTADTFTINIIEATSAVPEPATWLLLMSGIGIAGAALRRRTRAGIAAAR